VNDFLDENPNKETRDRIDEVKDKFAQVTILENLNFSKIYNSSIDAFKNETKLARKLDLYKFLGKLSTNFVFDNAFWSSKSHYNSMSTLNNFFATSFNY